MFCVLFVCSWVYYEMGTMCHVKAVEGTRRDNVTDLIKVSHLLYPLVLMVTITFIIFYYRTRTWLPWA